MAHFAPEDAFETLKERTVEAVKGHFPVEGSKNTLTIKNVTVQDNKDIDDIRGQQDARLKGRSWTVPVKATVELRDKATGKVKDAKTVTIAQLPKITRRYSHIVDGNEWQVGNQFRLKSGVYTRVKDNGELSSQWNLAEGLGFDMDFNPAKRQMTLGYNHSNVPVYPVLKAMGVDDKAMEKTWGSEVFEANKDVNEGQALRKLYKAMTGKTSDNLDEIRGHVKETFGNTKLLKDTTAKTLGQPFDKVSGEALLSGAGKLLRVSRQEDKPDDRDSLEFKALWSAEDLMQERLSKDARYDISRKLKNNIDRKDKVTDIVTPDTFGKPVKSFFTNSSFSERSDQRNPVGFLVGARKTTILGQHGIDSERRITLAAQSINPSHTGFLDPVHTPEGKRIGAVTQLSSGARKVGQDLKIPLVNLKTGKKEMVGPGAALNANIAFADQFKKVNGKLVPRSKQVEAVETGGDMMLLDPKKVDYVFDSTKGMYDVSSNMVPFLQNDQGNRSMVASRQLEQAVPLVHREQPLVQTRGDRGSTFEKAVGMLSAHHSPVAGTIERVGKQSIMVKDGKGKRHEVQLYDDFPLNDDKSVVNSTPLVKKGDKVKPGQTVADTSFTRDGTLSLGTNLRTAYMPWKGLNFEDGIVISETAAKKLTSEHLHRQATRSDENTILNKRKFLAETAGKVTRAQADKLDDDAVVRPGQLVESGDILIGELKKELLTPEQKQLALFSRKAAKPVRARPQTWEKDYPGMVSKVVKHGKDTTVYVKTQTPAEVGDKVVGRHGNKGIVTSVLADVEMPTFKDGTAAEILLNPAGIPGRINIGQAFETAASKIAEKTGKIYATNNFDPDVPDQAAKVMAELKQHGLSATEEMFDPQTKKPFKEKVLAGKQYILKLHHTAEKKLSARSRDTYTGNMTPQRGGPHGGQSMDASGMYALLAHGATANVREMQTIKSDMNDELWAKMQTGEPIPPPRVPFVYKKFESMLRGAGVNVKKDGNSLVLEPLTDKGTLALSNGEIKDPGRRLRAKDATPEKDGLFDPVVTGTRWPKGRFGDKWAHIKLSERMPNPTFEKPVRTLLGLNTKEFGSVMEGKVEIEGKTSAKAVVSALSKIDVEKDLGSLENSVADLRGAKLDTANKKIKFLRALKTAGLSPKEAYTMKYVPVLPANMRPISVMPNGDLNEADLNGIYAGGVGAPNHQLKTFDKGMPEEERHPLVNELYDGLKALNLTGMTYKRRHRSGIVEQIAGPRGKPPKLGFFQDKVIGRRQDMSMRSTIVPDPTLNLDEVGLPRKAASEMYKPFTVARMVRMGLSPLEAQKHIKEDSPTARRALEIEASNRPVLLKRDPVLHKQGVQAFRPQLVEGKTIKIHPLVTSGYNADFDGDTMSAFVPVTPAAVKEAHKMFPSNNLFSQSWGDIAYKPDHEAALGIFKLSQMGKKTKHVFATPAEAAKAAHLGKIDMTDVVTIKNISGKIEDPKSIVKTAAKPVKTTVGRLLLHNSLPEEVRDSKMLTDPKFEMTKSVLSKKLSEVARKKKGDYAQTTDNLKDLGNEYATGFSMGLEDFAPNRTERDRVLRSAKATETKIRSSKMTKKQKNDAVIKLYTKADEVISDRTKKQMQTSGNRMYDWVKSGSRGSWDQFKQLAIAPMLVLDSSGKTVPVPITKSYSEGLSAGQYWTAMHGARMGMIGKGRGTELPGALSKQMINTAINQVVTADDCETSKGITFGVDDTNALDRFTTKEIRFGVKGGKDKGKIPAGTLVTPEVMTRLKNNKVKEIPVRTPLKCAHGSGICAKCMGLNEDGQQFPKGDNVGIKAAQALGEPTTQLVLRSFHEGGVAGSKSAHAVGQFDRLKQLVELPEKVAGAATLSTMAGKIEKVDKDPAGGWNVQVGGQRHFVPGRNELAVKQGQAVKRGDALSSGPKNPRHMLPLTGIGSVQRYLTDEIVAVYNKKTPLHRRNAEVVVRSLTNLSAVNDPGSHYGLLRGDTTATSEINSFNSKLSAGKKPVQHTPILKGVNIMPLEMQTDWLARMQATRLKTSLEDGAAQGWKSNIHSRHPIPGMAYGKEFGLGTEQAPWLY